MDGPHVFELSIHEGFNSVLGDSIAVVWGQLAAPVIVNDTSCFHDHDDSHDSYV